MLASPLLRIRPLSRFSEFSSHLTEKHFYAMFGVAIILHFVGLTIYQLLPHEEVMQIPVKSLNIKLGGGSGISEREMSSIDYAATPQDAKSGSAEAQALLDTALAPVKNDLPMSTAPRRISSATAKKASAMQSQFVREGGAPSGAGEALGNSAEGEEMMRRYEQVLSLWIERHKVYPSQARAGGMEGDAIIRIRIDRQGKIILYKLEQATRFSVLNEAMEDMVRSASPVPAVPINYPAGDRFEFLIPVSFRLQ